MSSAESRKPYCSWCDLPFETRSELKEHLSVVHGAISPPISPEFNKYVSGLKRKSETKDIDSATIKLQKLWKSLISYFVLEKYRILQMTQKLKLTIHCYIVGFFKIFSKY